MLNTAMYLPQQMRLNEQQGLQNSGTQMLMNTVDKATGMLFQGANLAGIQGMGGGQQQQQQIYYPWQGQYSPNFQNQMYNTGQTQLGGAQNLGADPYSMGYRPPITNLPGQ